MLALTTDVLELRGVVTKTSQKGTTYYILNTEDMDGSPFQFYVRKFEVIPPQLKKGDLIQIFVNYNRYKELEVIQIKRAE